VRRLNSTRLKSLSKFNPIESDPLDFKSKFACLWLSFSHCHWRFSKKAMRKASLHPPSEWQGFSPQDQKSVRTPQASTKRDHLLPWSAYSLTIFPGNPWFFHIMLTFQFIFPFCRHSFSYRKYKKLYINTYIISTHTHTHTHAHTHTIVLLNAHMWLLLQGSRR
jgi:hypothetical protein